MKDMLQVGVITSTHGLQGEVKVFPTTDDIHRFEKLKQVYLDTGSGFTELEIERVRFSKKQVILKFKNINSINEIEKYKAKPLLVTRENAVLLEEGEYFITDLIDCLVIGENGENIGTLADVLLTGANDVYVVKTKEGKEILLPAIKDCILNINLDKREIKVHLLDGLLD